MNGRVAAYQDKLKGATPDQAAGEIQSLRDQLAQTKKQLSTIQNPPRDQNAVYQNGQQIGIVAGVQIDSQNQTVVFQQMTISGELDEATNIDFRNLILSFRGSSGRGQVRMGPAATTTYGDVRFAIVGHRSD